MTSAFSVGLYKVVVFLSSRGFGFIFIIIKKPRKARWMLKILTSSLSSFDRNLQLTELKPGHAFESV